MSDSKIKLVWNGPDSTVNADVAAETGNSKLWPGREINVSAELAALLTRSCIHWSGDVALSKMKLPALRAAAAAAGVPDADSLSKKDAIAAIEAANAATPDPDGAAGAEEDES